MARCICSPSLFPRVGTIIPVGGGPDLLLGGTQGHSRRVYRVRPMAQNRAVFLRCARLQNRVASFIPAKITCAVGLFIQKVEVKSNSVCLLPRCKIVPGWWLGGGLVHA